MHSGFTSVLLIAALALPLAAQQPDTTRADTTRARRLAPVVVSGARLAPLSDPRLPAQVRPLDLARPTHGASSAADLLARLPGVGMSNDQGSHAQPTLELRGFMLSPVVGVPQGVSVFLDGVRVNEPDAQEVNFDLLPMEAIDHAELVTGTSAVYGKNSLAGALVLRSARGDSTPMLRGGIEAGSFGERNAHLVAGGIAAGFDGLAMLAGTTDDGYQVQSGATTRQAFATLGRRGPAGDVALSVLYGRNRLSEAGSLPERWLGVARRANFTGGDFFRPDLVQVTLRGERSIGPGSVRGNLFTRRNAIEQLNINAGGANTRAFVANRSAGGSAELALQAHAAGRPLSLAVGAELARSRVDYRVLAESNADAPGLPDGCDAQPGDATALCEDAMARGDDAAMYGQAILQATPALSLLASLRGDLSRVPFEDRRDAANSGTSTFRQLSPKLGATLLLRDVRLFGSVGSAFRAPAALELACASPEATCPLPFSLGADPPLEPVVAWSYELGGSWTPAPGATLALSAYHTDVRNEIVFVSAERAAGYFHNVPRTRRQGIEGSFTLPLPHEGLRAFGSYAFVNATYRSSVLLASVLADNQVEPGTHFAQSPAHRGTLGLGLTHVRSTTLLDAELSARGVTSSWLRGDEANRMPPLPGYVVSDLRVLVRRQRLSATVRVANLLDRRYAVFGIYAENPKGGYGEPRPASPEVERFLTPAYPRTITLGLSLEL